MGNAVVWKPSQTAILSNWYVFQILREAGLPDGVINFVPGDPGPITEACLDHPEFAGVHFTGSSAIFRSLFREVGERIDRYRSYPRLVGETGGKDFVVMHASADPQAVAVALVRGSFEYSGPEVLRRFARVHPRHALARGARARAGARRARSARATPPT